MQQAEPRHTPGSTRPVHPRRRLLLVSYHYPPSEETGALRWQRLTAIAARYGWDVDAISLAASSATRSDQRRLDELPPGTGVFGVPRPTLMAERIQRLVLKLWHGMRPEVGKSDPAPTPRSRKSFLMRHEIRWVTGGPRTLLRAWGAWLTHAQDQAWSKAATSEGLQVGRRHPPDLVISCGPPHMAHMVGRQLAAAFDVPFVMDMRDPWSLVPSVPEDRAHPLWYVLATRAEARCISQAALIVMNTPGAAAAMEAKWPGAWIISVMNGWDEEEIPEAPWPRQFRVVYAGVIYIDRTPRPFFRAAARVVRTMGLTESDFEIRLIGDVRAHDGVDVRQMAAEEGVDRYVRIMPAAPRPMVLSEYAEAALLLSLPQDSELAVPSKVFEYMRFPAWILAQSGAQTATGMVLRDTAAFAIDPADIDSTTAALTAFVRDFHAGRRPEPLAAGGRYSREAEARKLFEALESLLGPRPAPGF